MFRITIEVDKEFERVVPPAVAEDTEGYEDNIGAGVAGSLPGVDEEDVTAHLEVDPEI